MFEVISNGVRREFQHVDDALRYLRIHCRPQDRVVRVSDGAVMAVKKAVAGGKR